MAIERLIVVRNKIIDGGPVIAGFGERLSPTTLGYIFRDAFSVDMDETRISVETADDVIIVFRSVTYQRDEGGYRRLPFQNRKETPLSKNEINESGIRSATNFLGRSIIYRWVPSVRFIDPDKEKSIQDLITNGTYTEEQAKDIRESLLYEAQQARLLLPPKK